MRRKEREVSAGKAMEIIDKCKFATIATARSGEPYAVTVSIVRDGDKIYFHGAISGKKNDCFNECDKVCLSCVGDVVDAPFTVKYESATVYGVISEATDIEEKRRALYLLSARHSAEYMADFDKAMQGWENATKVWRVDIESVSGKSSFKAQD